MLSSKHTDHLPSKNALVVKSNRLVEASYDLTMQQLRLVHWLSRAVQEDDEDYKYYEIDVPLFLQFLNLKGSNSSRDRIRQVTQRLQEKTILIRNPDNLDEWEQFSWLRYSRVIRRDNRLVLRLSINPEMLPYLRDLRSAFTKTGFYQITSFNSRYGWRFYEWCKQFEGIGWLEISVAELRRRLQIGETEYTRFNNLRQRVVAPALAEICAVSDINVILVKTIKKGRHVDSLRFKIERKEVHVMPPDSQTEPSEEALIVERLVAHNMPIEEAKKNVRKHYSNDREYLLYCLADLETKVEQGFPFEGGNPLIWLRYLLKNDQRPQSTLFTNSANRTPSAEEQKALTDKHNARQRISYLEETALQVAKQYGINRTQFIETTLPNIDTSIRQQWLDEMLSSETPQMRQLIRDPEDVWSHRGYRTKVDTFFVGVGIEPLTYDSYCTSVGYDPQAVEAEIEQLKVFLGGH